MADPPVSPWRQRFNSYIEPLEPVNHALWTLSVAVRDAFRTEGYRALWGFSKWQDQGFANWFKDLNKHFINFEDTTALPELVRKVDGRVLELGPGLGNQLSRFNAQAIEHVYGVEPNTYLIEDLKANVAACGLSGKYTVIVSGVEDTEMLEKNGVHSKSLDTILSVQVLCSAPKPEAVARELYRMLKPGGKIIFWEHHRSHDRLTVWIQNLWNLIWSRTIGGCNINRDIVEILRQAGEWDNLDSIEDDEEPWSMLPRVWGILIKPTK